MRPGEPVGKQARRLGVTPTNRTAKIVVRRPNPPGVHGARRGRRKSVFGDQLIEKQKLKFQFMISEKALQRAYVAANKMKGKTGDNMIKILDRRLDATIFRSGIVNSIPAARQLVSHSHALVNGKRVDIPSYMLKDGDVVTFVEKVKKFPFIIEGLRDAEPASYIELGREDLSIQRKVEPEVTDIPVQCDQQLIVEWYSR